MAHPIPFRTREQPPRAREALVALCYAHPIVFTDDRTWPPALVKDMAQHNGIPCGAGVPGQPGIWCAACRFGEVTEDLPF